ncbi:MAG: c-type cytochrome biogenesis protein CcmI [Burkholderiaceae bacterium]|jgi:cytochrome c-type biogenesis protein CcmH|nr:c-type cytochrome biogenesis protein CcmI [Betaproteobacteria bacterium]
MFLLIGLTLVLCTALVLIWPLLRKKPPVDQGPGDEAIAAVFKERRRQIQRDLQAGLIQANEAHSAEEALTQELADRLESSTIQTPRRPWLAAFLALSLPVTGLSIYLIKGSPELALPGAGSAVQSPAGMRSLEELAKDESAYRAQVAQWQRDLHAKPDDINTWLSLALLQKAAGNYSESTQSFTEALKRGADQDGRSLAEFAETIALGRGKRFEGEPYDILKRAIGLEPNDAKVVSLMAAAHFQAGEKAQARGLLEQLLAALPKESAQAEQLRGLIESLPRDSEAASIRVTLSITPAMLKDLSPIAVLYVSARAAQGPRMPIAVWRANMADIRFIEQDGAIGGGGATAKPEGKVKDAERSKTIAITLSKAQQLDASRPLRGELLVEAHISQSGLAGRQAGDPIAQAKSLTLEGKQDEVALHLDISERYKP